MHDLLQTPVIGVIESRKQVDFDVLHPLVEPFEFVIIVEERSGLFFVENFLIAKPVSAFLLFGKRLAQVVDNMVELLMLKRR